MKIMQKSLAMLMALLMVFSLFGGITIPANAATVVYQYGSYGSYSNVIKNWGVRGELATFLSPNAEKFYQGTSYMSLASKTGSSDITAVDTSALYKALNALMTTAHTTINSYGDIRYLSKFTDIEQNGSVTQKISSFYSGTLVGPDWDWNTDRTWTREHTWPDSKGGSSNTENKTKNNESDIMMVRPVPLSENSSRSNTAYGVSSGYYYPNKESGDKYDVRGDVARTVLYVYVRWGTTDIQEDIKDANGTVIDTITKDLLDNMWGTSGVIESKEVLLTWMEEDPVDTWEMGRNDSVQSITGTRNVFVDYPELAFELFEEAVPDMPTPSGIADGSAEPEVTEPEPTEPETTEPAATEAPADGYELITLDSVTEGNYLIGAVRSQTYPNVYLATGASNGYINVSDSYVTAQSNTISTSQVSGAKIFTFTGNNTDGFTIGYYDGNQMVYLGYTNIKSNHTLAFDATYKDIKWKVQAVSSGGFSLYTSNEIGQYRISQYKTTSEVKTSAIRGYSSGTAYTGIYLFASAECKHKNETAVVTKPTCTEQGYTTYFCDDCDEELYVEDYVAALGHNYQAVVTKPTLSSQGYTTHTCSVCKDSYKDSYTAALTNVDSWGLTLGSDLIVKFNIYVDSSIRASASVQITVADNTETSDTKDLTFSQNLCQVSMPVAAAQMTDTITVKLINGSQSVSRSYTVLSYAKTILAGNYDAATKTLVREMLNYGAAAQTYFDYKTDALATAGVTGMETAGKESVPEMAETDISISGQLANLGFYGASLVYRDKIAVRFYFNGSVDGVDFGGKTAELKDDMYYVEIADILPQNLNQQITVTATDAVGNTLTVSYSPMHYIVRMNQKDHTNLQNLMKALYNYHLAAKAVA